MGLDAGGRRLSGMDGENKRMPDFGSDFGRTFPGRRTPFREPNAQHRSTKQKAPSLREGALAYVAGAAYRLTWTLVPPAKGPAPWAPSPLETTFTQSESLSL